jgi:cyclase
MLKQRLIPVLFLRHGFLVRSERFAVHQNLGNPVAQVERYNAWDVDELVYIDITPDGHYDTQRADLGGLGGAMPASPVEIIDIVARKCFMPLTFGGKIRTLEDIRARMSRGADKVTLNTQALADPAFISRAAHEYGSQAIVVSVDVLRHGDRRCEVMSGMGKVPTGRTPEAWAEEVERLGAGEIFLNSVDRDGTATGYDLDLIRSVVAATRLPVIACGGVGRYEDFAAVLTETGAAAAAAGNIFHFRELAYPLAKRQLKKSGVNVR